MSKKSKKREKLGISGITIAFNVISLSIFSLFILSLILTLCTSKSGIKKLTKKYVSDVKADNMYLQNYKEYGFTEEMYYELIDGAELKEIIALVMSDRVIAIIHETEEYDYTEEYCKQKIEKIITDISENNNLNLTQTQISTLTTFTMDICGLTSMFIFKTPLMYRTAIFEITNDAQLQSEQRILNVLAKISSPVLPIVLFMMFVTTIVILVIVSDERIKDRLFLMVCDTMLYPSLICLALSFAELFGKRNASILVKYFFSVALIVGSVGVILSITGAIITRIIEKKKLY